MSNISYRRDNLPQTDVYEKMHVNFFVKMYLL